MIVAIRGRNHVDVVHLMVRRATGVEFIVVLDGGRRLRAQLCRQEPRISTFGDGREVALARRCLDRVSV